MDRNILAFVLFFAVFLLAYFGMHFYVFYRLSYLFEVKKTALFYILMSFLALSFPLASILERTIDGSIIKFFYILSSVWLGSLMLLFFSVLIYEILRLFFSIDSKITGIIILAVVFILTVYSIFNAFSLNIQYVNVPMKNLKEQLIIVQLSDIHLGTNSSDYLKKIVDKTNSLNPDIVMITGDFFDSSSVLDDAMVAPLNNLAAKTFFTIGNHEQYEGVDKIAGLLSRTKVVVLRNEVTEYKGIQIIGADNPSTGFKGKNTFLETLSINQSVPSVLMYHPPQDLDKVSSAGVSLQLSGHTHNGQIFPFNLIVKLFFPNMRGLYNYNGTYLYVSPGTGTWGPPMRLGSRNEITVIQLIPV